MTQAESEIQFSKQSSFSRVAVAAFLLSAITAFLFVYSGYGYQSEIWSLGTAFSILRNAAYATFGLILVNLLAIYLTWPGKGKKGMAFGITGLILSLSVIVTAVYWQSEAQKYPPIHDITTDIENPPAFEEIIPLRSDAPNPHEYLGGETSDMQREFYTDLQPVVLNDSPETVFETAVSLTESRGWTLVSANRENLKIEATEELPWFGFKDDVVIRIQPQDGNRTLVDMRSKSRIGRSDLGLNAYRIQQFLADLQKEL